MHENSIWCTAVIGIGQWQLAVESSIPCSQAFNRNLFNVSKIEAKLPCLILLVRAGSHASLGVLPVLPVNKGN